MSRRALLRASAQIGALAAAGAIFDGDGVVFGAPPARPSWRWSFAPTNPVLRLVAPWDTLACYDCCPVRRADGALWLYYSTRGKLPYSIGLAIDATGRGDRLVDTGRPVLMAPPDTRYGLSRPSVARQPDGQWRMWYSKTDTDHPWIGTALSADGLAWALHPGPVLTTRYAWEGAAVQCPNVIYDASSQRYRMWYSGGPAYEPYAVGFATSSDGVNWTRHSSAPVFSPADKIGAWDGGQIGSFTVQFVDGWYYAFYNAFQKQPFVSCIGAARSRDGVTGWERHPANPLIIPRMDGEWSAGMVYKPAPLWDPGANRWNLWFNASPYLNGPEQIGYAWSDGQW